MSNVAYFVIVSALFLAKVAQSGKSYNTITAYSPPTRTKTQAENGYGGYSAIYDGAGSYGNKRKTSGSYGNVAAGVPSYGYQANYQFLYPRQYAGSPGDENNDGVPDELDLNRDGVPDSLDGGRSYGLTRAKSPRIVYGLAGKGFYGNAGYGSLGYPRQKYRYTNSGIYV